MRHQRQPTRNRMGWTSNQLNAVSRMFVDFCAGAPGPVLDIGAAFGVATLPALAQGATVIANDLDAAHLAELEAAVPPGDRARLRLLPRPFPWGTELEPGSLAGVHASNVLHFLPAAELEEGARRIALWLAPGGRLFLQCGTPYQRPFARFVPEYERRQATGDPYPGWVADTYAISSHRRLTQIPRSLHLLDPAVLTRVFSAVGLPPERVWFYRRHDLPASLWYDGRESVGYLAARGPRGEYKAKISL